MVETRGVVQSKATSSDVSESRNAEHTTALRFINEAVVALHGEETLNGLWTSACHHAARIFSAKRVSAILRQEKGSAHIAAQQRAGEVQVLDRPIPSEDFDPIFQSFTAPSWLEKQGNWCAQVHDRLKQTLFEEGSSAILLIPFQTKGAELRGALALSFESADLALNDSLFQLAHTMGLHLGIACTRILAQNELSRANDRLAREAAERQRFADEVSRINDELSQFAHVASHDLQEPLRMVSSYAELLVEECGDTLSEEAELYMRFVSDGATRMRRMIRALLEYASEGSESHPMERICGNELVEQVLLGLNMQVAEAKATVQVSDLPEVVAHPLQLERVFQNLVSNALKFRKHEGARILVSGEDSNDEVTFSVSDNGIGLEQKHAEAIFNLFRRLHGRDKYPGTGLGLAICKKIVEQHGGSIWVRSSPGEGTTVSFSIPKRAATSSTASHSS